MRSSEENDRARAKVIAILLAAGSGSRMGEDKLFVSFGGRPLLLHAIEVIAKSEELAGAVIVLRPGLALDFLRSRKSGAPLESSFEHKDVAPPSNHAREHMREGDLEGATSFLGELLAREGFVILAINEQFEEGMGASIRIGARKATHDAGAFVLMLADMPQVSSRLVDDLVAAWRRSDRPIVAPTFHGKRGHPVVVSSSQRAKLFACKGDEGLRSLMKEHRGMVELVETGDPGCLFDVDRPRDITTRERVLIKGAGEHASGTAHRLFTCGFSVVMTEIERPTAVRRSVSFCNSIYSGEIEVEGVLARRYLLADFGDDRSLLNRLARTHIPVVVDEQAAIKSLFQPEVIIDARILKRNVDNTIRDAPLVIGYGPGIAAGVDVHAVVETMRGHDLGRIIWQGEAAANTGVPGSIAGESVRRLLSAPCDGIVEARVDIGALVEPGDLICTVGGVEVRASISGCVRGLVYSGIEVGAGQKIGDIDPRGEREHAGTISDKARCISGAALEIILSRSRGRRIQ